MKTVFPKYSFYFMQALYWAASAAFNGYVAAFALSKGFSESFVSSVFSIGAMVSLIGLFAGSAASDILHSSKKLFIPSVASIVPLNLIMFFSRTPWLFLAAYLGMTLFAGPSYAILDAWSLKSFHQDTKKYGHSRACGSASYAVVILLSGWLIEKKGYGTAIILSIGLYALLMLFASFTKDVEQDVPLSAGTKNKGKDFSFMKIPVFLGLCTFMLFAGMGASPYQSLKILLLQNVGSGVSMQGVDLSISCVIQVFVFYYCEKLLGRFGPVKILIACSLMIFLGVTAGYFATSPWLIITGSCLLQINYGLLIPTVRAVASGAIPEENITFSNSVIDACYGSFAMTISMAYSGRVAETRGIGAMLAICMIMAGISVLAALLVSGIRKKSHIV